ncbi:glycosyltransferase family 4 protein [Cohnella sp. REN36]|uniref:glycosyltransferase family 4 protein n=1 Tax=Cohnella sp. REN36 TaxID=2887347 RepID=UPI001D13C680|nr:glycosyltransferase family 4 protein [Cohnella sp. REN36]MCC3375998.1 glycosyltransferase family 4 protein [Cohnella sp. REN36]
MRKKTVYLMDSTLKGHHRVYLEALKTISDVQDISKEFEVTSSTKHIVSYIQDRRKIVNYAFKQSNQDDILHLLYLDNLYMASPFMSFPKGAKVIGTLHHFPNSKAKERLLKSFSKKLDMIVVHSDFIAKQLQSIGIHHFIVIDYPVFHSVPEPKSREQLRREAGIEEHKIVISALGGTRFDKGLDILLEAITHLSESEKDQLLINIAGKEETYKKDFILGKLQAAGIKDARVQLRLLSDEEFENHVQLTDAIVVPYRKVFTGNSGPMTEGIYRQKAIIGTNHGNLGYLIKQFKLGYTFEAEDAYSLAQAVRQYLTDGWSSNEMSRIYQERLRITHFVNRHSQLYQQWR